MSDPTGSGERLVQMANDIADYFVSEPDRELAIAGMVLHLERYWEPRMLVRICAIYVDGATALNPLAREALSRLADSRSTR
ncbi:MAG: formate dehydrogenase subunit delta [Dokdonella sp.]